MCLASRPQHALWIGVYPSLCRSDASKPCAIKIFAISARPLNGFKIIGFNAKMIRIRTWYIVYSISYDPYHKVHTIWWAILYHVTWSMWKKYFPNQSLEASTMHRCISIFLWNFMIGTKFQECFHHFGLTTKNSIHQWRLTARSSLIYILTIWYQIWIHNLMNDCYSRSLSLLGSFFRKTTNFND